MRAFMPCSMSARDFAQLVGISKSAAGKAVDYYRPEREAEVLRMALKRNQGPAARRRNRAAVSRNHVGLPRAAGTAQGGLLGPGRNLYAGGGAQALRFLGPRPAA